MNVEKVKATLLIIATAATCAYKVLDEMGTPTIRVINVKGNSSASNRRY